MKPSYDDLKWKIMHLASGEIFTVPPRKLYEVFCKTNASGSVFRDLEGGVFGIQGVDGIWHPAVMSKLGFWPFDNIDPATGAVTYLGSPPDPLFNQNYHSFNTFPTGWILSEGETLECIPAAAWHVRYRDVTKLYVRDP